MISKIFKNKLQLVHFLFPNVCIHCAESSESFFCIRCQEHFELLEKEILSSSVLAAFANIGPARSLQKEMQRPLPSLLQLAASFMVYQYLHFQYPFPDLVVPFFGKKNKNIADLTKKVAILLRSSYKNPLFLFLRSVVRKKRVLFVTDIIKKEDKDRFLKIFPRKDFPTCYLLGLLC